MGDTDAAGVVYFSRFLDIMHEAYEHLLQKNEVSIQKILQTEDYILPIAACEARYLRPLFLGDSVEVRIKLKEIQESTFSLMFEIYKKNKLVATGTTSHACISKTERKKKLLPSEVKAALSSL